MWDSCRCYPGVLHLDREGHLSRILGTNICDVCTVIHFSTRTHARSWVVDGHPLYNLCSGLSSGCLGAICSAARRPTRATTVGGRRAVGVGVGGSAGDQVLEMNRLGESMGILESRSEECQRSEKVDDLCTSHDVLSLEESPSGYSCPKPLNQLFLSIFHRSQVAKDRMKDSFSLQTYGGSQVSKPGRKLNMASNPQVAPRLAEDCLFSRFKLQWSVDSSSWQEVACGASNFCRLSKGHGFRLELLVRH